MMVSTLDADTVAIDRHGSGARSRIGVVPTTNVLGKSKSESPVLEFRR